MFCRPSTVDVSVSTKRTEKLAITKTGNGESGKGIGERGMGMRNGKTRNTKKGNLENPEC